MDETKQPQTPYSRERLETASTQIPPEAAKPIQSSGTEQAGQFSGQMQMPSLSGLLEIAEKLRHLSLAEFVSFLKRTRRLWLTAAAAAFGLVAIVTATERVTEWARNARERRHEIAVATVTPDRLIARCGAAAQDATKEVYPIVMRTMSYKASGNRNLVVAFSRTAEENSTWVFLSMNDEGGAITYDTPDAKIAALPCLDSKK